MFGIQYVTDDGQEYYCTGKYGLQFSEDVNDVQEYVSHENARKIANTLNKDFDLNHYLGQGKLYVIEVIKIPMQREYILNKTLKPGYRIQWDNSGTTIFYNGQKTSKYGFGFSVFGGIHNSTVFKSEKEAKKTIDAIQEYYKSYYQTKCYGNDPVLHEKRYKPYYDQSLTYTIVYKD